MLPLQEMRILYISTFNNKIISNYCLWVLLSTMFSMIDFDHFVTSWNNGNCEEDLPKKPVGRLSVNCRPSVDRQSADCWPTVGRVSTNSRPTVGRQSAVRRPTDFARNIGYLSADSWPTAHRQSTDRFFGELFFTITKLRFVVTQEQKLIARPQDAASTALHTQKFALKKLMLSCLVFVKRNKKVFATEYQNISSVNRKKCQ